MIIKLIVIVAIIATVFFGIVLWINKAIKPISSISFDCTMEETTDQLFDRNW
ncbi:MAG: hypothetical protein PHR61_04085 [Candidatus Absconditabacteria bacterium]|nr:hypothetical protein [Candidatus Absconditabacteria bacterium]